ncbi:MAG: transpeptidase family protein [Tannerella sp.]|jgi:cell division protein FtsI (penicillin-binding protein 3)|nr:transpeptidase family protein [Tannerella sp.]
MNAKKRKEEKVILPTLEKKRIIDRYRWILILLLILVSARMVVAIFMVGFVEKERWIKVAERQKRPIQRVKPDRGDIYSSDGQLMVTSVPRYYLYMDFRANGFKVDSFLHSSSNGVDSLAYYLSKKLKNRTVNGYKSYLIRGMKSQSRVYPLYEGRVSYVDLKEIEKFPFIRKGRNSSGFFSEEVTHRHKYFGSLAARTLGNIYNEMETKSGLPKGKNGLEQQYDSLLRGQYGTKSFLRVGNSWTGITEEETTPGMDLVTTIDIRIQDITEKALINKLREIDAETGIAIVMEVRTGEIKAISNMERVGPGNYVETGTRNFALTNLTEPGSTFKIPSIMVALEDKVCTPDELLDVGNGIYRYEGRDIIDHNAASGGYHQITVAQAIWYSSNVGVAKTILKGYRDNPQKFTDGLKRVGIDAELKIQGGVRTNIRTPSDPRWSKLTLPWTSFGYEVEVSPIQMLAFYNAIANNGKMIRPVFVKEVRQDGRTVQSFSTEVVRNSVCSKETLKIVREMMLNVVEKGLGQAVRSGVVTIAGKTGTAKIASAGGYSSHQVSFCGYFPAETPEYSCIVIILRPRFGNPSGSTMSGSVFKTIAEKVYAGQMRIDLRALKTASSLPEVKNGDARALTDVLAELDIRTEPRRAKTDYVVGKRQTEERQIQLKELTIKEGVTPDVTGMGARDAVYLLERCGLNVRLSGWGQVVSQSVTPGSPVVKGQSVSIILNN